MTSPAAYSSWTEWVSAASRLALAPCHPKGTIGPPLRKQYAQTAKSVTRPQESVTPTGGGVTRIGQGITPRFESVTYWPQTRDASARKHPETQPRREGPGTGHREAASMSDRSVTSSAKASRHGRKRHAISPKRHLTSAKASGYRWDRHAIGQSVTRNSPSVGTAAASVRPVGFLQPRCTKTVVNVGRMIQVCKQART
jgi:hypothetical protein